MLKTIKISSDTQFKKSRTCTQSSLLIPEILFNYFNQRVKNFGGRRRFFAHLISIYGINIDYYGMYPNSDKWKKQYQKEGLNLHKLNFIPGPELWEEFRNIASTYGLSMCHLFVFLLELEHQRWVQAGKPENFKDFPPKIPGSIVQKQKMWNSNNFFDKKPEIDINKLANNLKITRMIRTIDFKNHILLKTCYIHDWE